MSLIREPEPRIEAPPTPPARRPAGAPWGRVALAVLLVAGSAGLRLWQQSRVDERLRSGRSSPFPLAEIPLSLGDWTGKDEPLDPQVARTTGAVDHISRMYIDERTGVRMSVIVLYGPAEDVSIHAPEICYPVAGYAEIGQARTWPVRSGDHDVPFRALTYGRGPRGEVDRQHVYYTWYYQGRWSPDRTTRKHLERIPGMLKVHVARAALPSERLDRGDPGDPCQDFLARLMPEIERRMAAAGATPPPAG